jgi:hypothetical protein
VAEVEDYNRVELLPIDESMSLAGQAVSDVVHLLAELVENATSFSPPGTKVQVAGQAISSGYVLEIEDRGLGMSDEELIQANERLANPPMVDFALSRMLGLYVVARLAQRYDIKVQLRHSWYGGITALVLLPSTVTVQAPVPEALSAAPNGRHQWPELASPTRPSSDGGAGQVAAPAAAPAAAREAGDGQSGEQHLPIFEAARSDWFDEADLHRDHLPLRRHAAEQETTAAESAWWGGAAGAEPSSAATAEPQQQPPPPSVAESRTPRPAPSPVPPPVALRHLRPENQPSTPPASPPPAPVTRSGLPRRVPRANLAPGMLAMQAEQEPSAPVDLDRPPATDLPPSARARSPEEVRSMLSSYRSGVERGRTQSDPESAAELPRSSRSDDAPSQ